MNRMLRSALQWRGYLLALLPVAQAIAGAGDFDPTFGTGGFFEIPAPYSVPVALPDGRLQFAQLVDGKLSVLRVDANGRTNAIPGANPAIETPVPWQAESLGGGGALEDGRSYLVGTRMVVRLAPDGTPDTTFGPHGVREFPYTRVPGADISNIWDVKVAPSGAVYVLVGYQSGGAYYNDEFQDFGLRLFRLKPDGDLDPSFASGGEYALVNEPDAYNGVAFLMVLPDDTVLLQGPRGNARLLDAQGRPQVLPVEWRNIFSGSYPAAVVSAGPYHFTAIATSEIPLIDLARWRADLSLDTTFGANGTGHALIDLRELPITLRGFYGSLLLLAPTGAEPYLFLTAYVNAQRGTQIVVRLHADGRIDRSFGENGVIHDGRTVVQGGVVREDSWIRSVTQQPDGSGIFVSTFVDMHTPFKWTYQRRMFRLASAQVDTPTHVSTSLSCEHPNVVQESAGYFRVQVSRTLGSRRPLGIGFRTQAVSATADVDYGELHGSVSWADGETGTRSFDVPLFRDSATEQDEEFDIFFQTITGDAIRDCASVRVVIAANSLAVSPPAALPPSTPPAAPSPPPRSTSGISTDHGGGALDGRLLAVLGLLLLCQLRRQTVSSPRS